MNPGGYYGRDPASTSFAYGDFTSPHQLGSGGGRASSTLPGGNGGGLVRITATSVVVNGAIRANGTAGAFDPSNRAAGGSGGGIFLDTITLSGSGTISADGGAGGNHFGGAGGGGRVALLFEDRSGFTGAMTAFGGTAVDVDAAGGAGTVFLRNRVDQQFGHLIADNNGITNARPFSTPLRAVGPGISTGLLPTTLTDAAASFPVPDSPRGALGLNGLRLNPNTAQGQLFTIVGNTTTVITIDSLEGDMTQVGALGAPYIGVYQLDQLSVLNGSQVLTLDDVIIIGTLSVDGQSLFQSNNLSEP